MILEPKISIVLLNLNQHRMTIDCIESLTENDYTNFEIILVDNGSTDNSVEIFESLPQKYQNLKFIKNRENLGFAEGNNVGIRNSDGDYILLLNNDTIVKKDFLSSLVDATKKFPNAGAFGPKMYSYDKPLEIWHIGGEITKFLNFTHTPLKYKDSYKSVDWLSGCALMMNRETVEKVGLLNSSFFIYFEDVEWCIRAKKAGYDLIYVPNAELWHIGSVTSKERGGTTFFIYYGYRNKLFILKKHYTGLISTAIYIETMLSLLVRSIISLLKGDRTNGMAYFYALVDGVRGVSKKRFLKVK